MRHAGFIGFLAAVLAVVGGAMAIVGSAVACGKAPTSRSSRASEASKASEARRSRDARTEEPSAATAPEEAPVEPELAKIEDAPPAVVGAGGTIPFRSDTPPPAPRSPPPPPPGALTLLSTHLSDDGDDDAATLVHPDTGFGGMYAVGERVEGPWILDEVGPTIAVLRDDASGAEHTIDLAIPRAGGTGEAPREAGKVEDDAMPEGPQTVSRTDLSKAASDPKAIGARAKVGKDGTIKLASVKRGSAAHKLGFRKGDVLVSVAGVALTSPDAALDAMQKVKTASRTSVVINRKGAEITLEFNLTE